MRSIVEQRAAVMAAVYCTTGRTAYVELFSHGHWGWQEQQQQEQQEYHPARTSIVDSDTASLSAYLR